MPESRTVAALLTPVGEGGISVVGLSGPSAFRIALSLFRPGEARSPGKPRSGKLCYGHLYEGEELLDEVLLAFFDAEESPTGHEMVEINCHGGLGPADAVIKALVRAGAREGSHQELLALFGASGKADSAIAASATTAGLDRIQAEAASLIQDAPGRQAAGLLVAQYRGALSVELRMIAGLLDAGQADPARTKLGALLETWPMVRRLLSPPVIALVGKTNVGKSTLLNALLGYARAITCEEPGTTRDHVAERIGAMDAVLELVDTAGLGGPSDPLSREAERRTAEVIDRADVVVFLFAANEPLSQAEADLIRRLRGRALLAVAAKSDLGSGPALEEVEKLSGLRPIAVSALSGEGLERLKEEMARSAAIPTLQLGRPVLFTQGQVQEVREVVALVESGECPLSETAARLRAFLER